MAIRLGRFGFTSFSNPAEARNLFKHPNLTISDARAIGMAFSAASAAFCAPSAACLPAAASFAKFALADSIVFA